MALAVYCNQQYVQFMEQKFDVYVDGLFHNIAKIATP